MFKPFRAFSGAGKAVAGGPDPETFTPSHLFAAGPAGHWPGGHDPAAGHLSQDSAGTVPAILPDQPVGLAKRVAGSVNASQATALSRPTLARHPKGGRRNGVSHSEDLALGWSANNTDTTRLFIAGGGPEGSGASQVVFPMSNREVTIPLPSTYQNVPCKIRMQARCNRAGARLRVNAGTSFDFAAIAANEWRSVTAFSPVGSTRLWIGSYGTDQVPQPGDIWEFSQVEVQAAPDTSAVMGAYQRTRGASDITQPGAAEIWHLWNDGGDSLNAGAVPAGSYGLAWVDVLGGVTVTTVTSDGAAPVNLLRAERQADVILRQGAFTTAEEA